MNRDPSHVHGALASLADATTNHLVNVLFWWVVGGLLLSILLGILMKKGIKIIDQYERGVVYTLGRVDLNKPPRQPGFNLLIPFAQQLVRVEVLDQVVALKGQTVITKDRVSLVVKLLVGYRVVDAVRAEVTVDGYENAVIQLAQSTMLRIAGGYNLTDILENGRRIAAAISEQMAEDLGRWGLEMFRVELREIELPEDLVRAMAAKAAAQADADAKVAEAEGEERSATVLAAAAEILGCSGYALRHLQVLQYIGADQNTIVVDGTGTTAQAAAGARAGIHNQA